MYIFKIVPIGKPRMTQRDKWLERNATAQYWLYKDVLNLAARQQKFVIGKVIDVLFLLPMPQSWSKKKQDSMRGESHGGKPDTDNLLKAFCDALTTDDSLIWDKRGRKYWWDYGAIVVLNNLDVTGKIAFDRMLSEFEKKNGELKQILSA